jgi:hypothetical protein
VRTRLRSNATRAAIGLLLLVAFALLAMIGARPEPARRASAVVAAQLVLKSARADERELRGSTTPKLVSARHVQRRAELLAPVELDVALGAVDASVAIADAAAESILAAHSPSRELRPVVSIARPRSRAPPVVG